MEEVFRLDIDASAVLRVLPVTTESRESGWKGEVAFLQVADCKC